MYIMKGYYYNSNLEIWYAIPTLEFNIYNIYSNYIVFIEL